MAQLSSEDRLEIIELNSRHFYALDGLHRILRGDPAEHFANTFTQDGLFEIRNSDDSIRFSLQGYEQLLSGQQQFPDIEQTRHWIGGLLIEPHEEGARSGSYIIAMNISVNPSTIIRTGTYDDLIVKEKGAWKYKRKSLILDAYSPSAE